MGPTGGTTLPPHLMEVELNSVNHTSNGAAENLKLRENDGDVEMDGTEGGDALDDDWIWEWRYESEEDDQPSFVIYPRLEEEVPELNSDDER